MSSQSRKAKTIGSTESMTDLARKWQELRDEYPPLEIPHDKEERTQFENWVAEMGFDGIIQIDRVKQDDKN